MSKPVRVRIGVAEAARAFANRHGTIVSTQTVRRWARAGKIKSVTVGARILIDPQSIDAMVQQTRQK